jgi:hypothetical protein
MPNQEQIKLALQWLLGAGGPLTALILSYGVSQEKLSLWTNLALYIIPPAISWAWGTWDRTHKNTIKAAAVVPGVSEVVIESNAKGGAAKAAADPALTNVNKVGGS